MSNYRDLEKRRETQRQYREKHREYYRKIERESSRRWKANHPTYRLSIIEWRASHPDAYQAHQAVKNAVRRGEIERPTICSKCGNRAKLDAHHEDYKKPLNIEWLCKPCHDKLHEKIESRSGKWPRKEK